MINKKLKLFLSLKPKQLNMKKIIALLCLAAGFAACNTKTDQTSPTATIDAMFTAMKSGNMEDIKKFITKKDVDFLESTEKFVNSIDSGAIQKMKTKMGEEFKNKVKDVKYTLKNEKVDGDKATVDAEVTDGAKVDKHTFNLIKEDGAWKISLLNSGGDGMFNSMKGNMGNDTKDLEKELEKFKNMNRDSLKMLMDKGMKAMDKGMKAMDSMKAAMEKH